MATPSDNLESIARTLEDVSLYTQATNMSLLGVNTTISRGNTAIANSTREMVKEVRFMSGTIVNLSKNILAKVGKAIFAPSVRRSNKTEEEVAAEAAAKKIKAEEKAAAKLAKEEERAKAKEEKAALAVIKANQREEQNALKEERRGKAMLIKEAARMESAAIKSRSKEEAESRKKEDMAKKAKKQQLDSIPDANFKNIISGAGGGIAGLFASVATETRNFLASIIKAYGEGGLGGLVRATAQVSTAFTGIPNALMSIVKAASPFVTALDPALMAKLGLAFADLMAVVGYGLRPIIVMAIAAIKMFGDMLLPVMKAMAPAISSMAGSIMQLVIPVLKIWADSIMYMIPVIESMGFFFRVIGETIAWASPILELGFKTLAAGLNALVAIIAGVVAGIKTLVVAVLDMVAWAMKKVPFMGETAKQIEGASKAVSDSAGKDLNDAAAAMGRMFEGPKVGPVQQGAGSGIAARGASFAGIGDLGKNLMQAAFGSSNENVARQQLDAQNKGNNILEKIAGALWGQEGGKMAGVRN